jgi:hypothetical protein
MDRSLRLYVTSDMDGGLLSELEFFPPTNKSANSVAGGGAVQSSNFGHSALGLYQNEESVDFSSWLPDVFSSVGEVPTAVVAVPSPQTVATGRASSTSARQNYREAPTTTTNGDIDAAAFSSSFGNFCSPPTPPNHNSRINMYDTEGSRAVGGISLPHSQTTITSLADQTSLLLPDPLVGTRPAPGKAPKKSSKKKTPEKDTKEYREKRERNNVAVRKSREKNRVQIMETQQRVKDLEDENSALQSKITLLSKELKVLKDLFASAGVSQPPSLCLKSEPEN